MELMSCTKDAISRLQSISGKQVVVSEKKDMAQYAKIKVARKSMGASYIFYRESENINHLIIHECAHGIRIMQCNSECRKSPVIKGANQELVVRDLKAKMAYLNQRFPDSYYVMLISNFIIQLTSMPQDIWVERWISETYPEIQHEQRKSLQKQWDEASSIKISEIKNYMPGFLISGSAAMNIAFFKEMQKIVNLDISYKPFAPYMNIGKKLLALTDDNKLSDYVDDMNLIDSWADALFAKWYTWEDFENIPDNYMGN